MSKRSHAGILHGAYHCPHEVVTLFFRRAPPALSPLSPSPSPSIFRLILLPFSPPLFLISLPPSLFEIRKKEGRGLPRAVGGEESLVRRRAMYSVPARASWTTRGHVTHTSKHLKQVLTNHRRLLSLVLYGPLPAVATTMSKIHGVFSHASDVATGLRR